MFEKNYALISGILFVLVAAVHAWRIADGWPVTVDGTAISMLASWVAVIIAGALGFYGLWIGVRRNLQP